MVAVSAAPDRASTQSLCGTGVPAAKITAAVGQWTRLSPATSKRDRALWATWRKVFPQSGRQSSQLSKQRAEELWRRNRQPSWFSNGTELKQLLRCTPNKSSAYV